MWVLQDAFLGVKEYCYYPEISRFQNSNYHRLTLQKLTISAIISELIFGFKIYLILRFSSKYLQTTQGCSGQYKNRTAHFFLFRRADLLTIMFFVPEKFENAIFDSLPRDQYYLR